MYEGHPGEIDFGLSHHGFELLGGDCSCCQLAEAKRSLCVHLPHFGTVLYACPYDYLLPYFSVEGHKFSYSTFIPFPLGDFGI